MTRSKRMQPVARVAHSREDAAARAYGASQRDLDEQRKRLQELISYRDEYTGRFQDTSGGGLNAVKLGEYRVFLSRLNQAIEQQKQKVQQAEQACEQFRQGWLALHARAQALDKVVDRFQREEQVQAERREQKELDDRTARDFDGGGIDGD